MSKCYAVLCHIAVLLCSSYFEANCEARGGVSGVADPGPLSLYVTTAGQRLHPALPTCGLPSKHTFPLLSLPLLLTRCITSSGGCGSVSTSNKKKLRRSSQDGPANTNLPPRLHTHKCPSLKTICEVNNTEAMCPVMHHNPCLIRGSVFSVPWHWF